MFIRDRLGHERRAQAMLFGHRLHHELEEAVLVGGLQGVGVFPVHLVLASRVLVDVLVGLPACLLYTSPSPRDRTRSRIPASA